MAFYYGGKYRLFFYERVPILISSGYYGCHRAVEFYGHLWGPLETLQLEPEHEKCFARQTLFRTTKPVTEATLDRFGVTRGDVNVVRMHQNLHAAEGYLWIYGSPESVQREMRRLEIEVEITAITHLRIDMENVALYNAIFHNVVSKKAKL